MATLRSVARLTLVPLLLLATPVHAQTVDDQIMIEGKTLFTGYLFTHDRWDDYWEGPLKRDNGNIGTLTTQTSAWYVNYGITNRLNVIATMPYVRTNASQGTLRNMQGLQDFSVAAKCQLFSVTSPLGAIRTFAVGSAGLPMTDYTPDFYPLSIGSNSRRASGRFTVNLQTKPGWFVTGSSAYTWRANVTLDRPYYFTDGQLFLTSDVDMPNVFDYALSGGYLRRGLMASASYSQQRTLGGGDIRRQDMPFVSNRMNSDRIGGMVMWALPKKLRYLSVQGAYTFTLRGRNVGQASTVTGGVMYTLPLHGRPTR
jgi:Putative MetA-pathway of phenol degradation